MTGQYKFLDSGNGMKLEDFGGVKLIRPCAQALWKPSLSEGEWRLADARFSREEKNHWIKRSKIPEFWKVSLEGLIFKINLTEFGHVGLFPEHSFFWKEMEERIRAAKTPPRILNLFAYSGGASLAAAKAGASVCHLDASKGMVAWARENAALNHLENAPIRWIVDDALKFLRREVKRGAQYEGILLDPPSFGRGAKGEVFKLEDALSELLHLSRSVLSPHPLFVIFSSHTAGISPLVLSHLISEMMCKMEGKITTGELLLHPLQGLALPCGSFARWGS